ncbi:MAG: hypothetical protein ABJD13_18560 [Paracoccaceae bacterium]
MTLIALHARGDVSAALSDIMVSGPDAGRFQSIETPLSPYGNISLNSQQVGLTRKAHIINNDFLCLCSGDALVAHSIVKTLSQEHVQDRLKDLNESVFSVLDEEYPENDLKKCGLIFSRCQKISRNRVSQFNESSGVNFKRTDNEKIWIGGSGQEYYLNPDMHATFQGGLDHAWDTPREDVRKEQFAKIPTLLMTPELNETVAVSGFGGWYEMISFIGEKFQPKLYSFYKVVVRGKEVLPVIVIKPMYLDNGDLVLVRHVFEPNLAKMDVGTSIRYVPSLLNWPTSKGETIPGSAVSSLFRDRTNISLLFVEYLTGSNEVYLGSHVGIEEFVYATGPDDDVNWRVSDKVMELFTPESDPRN